MREFKKHRSERQEMVRAAAGVAGALVLLALAIFAVRAAWGMFEKFKAASRGQEEVQTELGRLAEQQAKLQSSLATISTPLGQEQEMRGRFGVARPGEGEIEIVRDAASTTDEAQKRPSWWARVFHALFVW